MEIHHAVLAMLLIIGFMIIMGFAIVWNDINKLRQWLWQQEKTPQSQKSNDDGET